MSCQERALTQYFVNNFGPAWHKQTLKAIAITTGTGCECDVALWPIICEDIVCSGGYHLNSALFFKELTDCPDTVFLYTQEILLWSATPPGLWHQLCSEWNTCYKYLLCSVLLLNSKIVCNKNTLKSSILYINCILCTVYIQLVVCDSEALQQRIICVYAL